MSQTLLPQVQKTTLSNGLIVLHEQNASAAVVSLNIGVKVGSVWESNNEAGMSHLLEHMVFKGTKSYKPGEIASTVEALGGELNAYTSFDRTVYYINLPSEHWLKAFPFLKEMVFDAIIDPVELDREREVVIEELRRGKDNPDSVLGEMIFESAYGTHPYGRPIIGFEKNLKGYTSDDVLKFYHHWYVPNNMIFAICGNYHEHELRQILQELEQIPSKNIRRPEIPSRSINHRPSMAKKEAPVNANYLSIAFPITAFCHQDTAALDLLAHLLGGGDTSLLEQELKEKKHVVNAIHSYAYTPLFEGLFLIDSVVPNEHFSKVLSLIKDQIEHCQNHLFSSQDLDRAKMGMKSSLYYEKQTCEGTARKWMVYEATAGDVTYEASYFQHIDKVTVHDLRTMAKKYLDWDKASIAILYPHNTKQHSLPKSIKSVSKNSKKDPFRLTEEFQDIQKWQHHSGYQVITKENHRLPILSFKMLAPGGIRHETVGNNGITSLMTRMLEKGTTTRNALQIAEASEEIAGHISGISGRNSWGLSTSMISEKTEKGLDLFFDVLLHPLFDEKEIGKEKRLIIEALRQEEDSLSTLAFKAFQKCLFKSHPYGLPQSGTVHSIKKMSGNQIKAHHSKLLNPKKCTFVCVGDFVTRDLLELIDHKLAELRHSGSKLVVPKAQKAPQKIITDTIYKDKMQAHVVLGFLGTTITSPDRYALEIINNLLSGQGGRLFLDLRDTQSLAYTVTSSMTEGLEPGYFATYIGTEAKKLDLAIAGLKKHLHLLTEELISDQELLRAKNYIIGSHELDHQRLSAYASTLAMNNFYGFNLAEIDNYRKKILAVTPEECLRVAKKYFNLSAYVLTCVRPKKI